MSTIALIKPVTERSIHLVKPAPKTTTIASIPAKAETNPMIVIFVSCIIAFHLAAAMVGSVVAWAYYLR